MFWQKNSNWNLIVKVVSNHLLCTTNEPCLRCTLMCLILHTVLLVFVQPNHMLVVFHYFSLLKETRGICWPLLSNIWKSKWDIVICFLFSNLQLFYYTITIFWNSDSFSICISVKNIFIYFLKFKFFIFKMTF